MLIVRLSALGDTALTVPLFAAIRAKLPGAHIGWVTNEGPSELLEGLAGLDRLHVLGKTGSRIRAIASVVRDIRGEKYDVALDAQGLTKSAILPFLAGVPVRAGLAPGRVEGRELSRFLNNRTVRPPRELRHIVARTLQLATALGPPFETGAPSDLPVEMPVAAQALEKMRAWWKAQGLSGEAVVFGVGAGWPTKVWPVEKVARLAEAARERGRDVVFQWGPAERLELARWREVLPKGTVLTKALAVGELVAMLSLAERYAGPDSAALHVSALLGKPTFSWFGASDPDRCAPRGAAHVHVDAGVECGRCWRRRCRSMDCITRLDVEKVLPLFKEWLGA